MHRFNLKRTWGPRMVALITMLLAALILPSAALAAPNGPPSALDPASEAAAAIANLHNIVLIIAVVIFVIVEGLLLITAFRFRRKPKDTGEGAQIHGNTRLEIAWTVAPALIVITLFVLTVRTQQAVDASAQATGDNAPLKVQVVGHQWWWEFKYPDQGFTTAGDLVIPVGRVVSLEITSVDVIHSFWVPELNGKTDAMRGVVNHSWIKADREGEFYGQCAELCGVSHANMRLVVTAVSEDQFATWAAGQVQDAATPSDPLAQQGQQVFSTGPCVGCHIIRGIPQAVGVAGPDLTHVGSRLYIAGGILANTPHNLARWLENPPGLKAGSIMPNLNLSSSDIDALTAYLTGLK